VAQLFSLGGTDLSMKLTFGILLVLLAACLNGCITSNVIERAKGHSTEWVDIEKGDKIVETNGISTLTRVNPSTGGQTVIRLWEMRTYGGKLYSPNAAYYCWLPLSIPADIVTSPFQLLGALAAGLAMENGHQ
jgi:hypothetical protein